MHGIKVLLKHLKTIEPQLAEETAIIEIGSSRDIGSTYYLSELCARKNLSLFSLDPSEDSHKEALKVFEKFDYPSLYAVLQKAEDYLADYRGPKISLSYLDGFDIVTDHPHKQSTIDFYTSIGIDLLKDGNRLAAESHLICTEHIFKHAAPTCFYCFDDTWYEKGEWKGKGATAIPFLLERNGKVVSARSKHFWQSKKYNHGVIVAVER